MSATAAASIDWESVATGAGVLVTIVLAGLSAIFKNSKGEHDPGTKIVGGLLMDNATLVLQAERLRSNTESLDRNTAALERFSGRLEDVDRNLDRAIDRLPR